MMMDANNIDESLKTDGPHHLAGSPEWKWSAMA
jgi:hypothetical protein